MLFFSLLAFILVVQILHWRVLRRIAPERLRRECAALLSFSC